MLKKFKTWRRLNFVTKHQKLHGNCFDFFGEKILLAPDANPEMGYLILKGRYEQPEAVLIQKYLAQGMHVIELGGSLGIVSQFTRTQIGPGATQVIIEADPKLADQCRSTLETVQPNEKTTVVHAALSYGGTSVKFASGGGNAHIGHVADDRTLKQGQDYIEVPALTLSDLEKRLPPNEPAALICDVEGAEFDILRQEAALLSKFAVWIVEFHPKVFEANGTSQTAFFAACKDAGLELLEVIENVAVFRPKAA